jgi:hypothetical protein
VRCCDVFEKIRVRSAIGWVAGEATVQVELWPRESAAVKEGTRLYGEGGLKRETDIPDEEREGQRCPNDKSKARFPLAVVEGRPKRSGSSRGAECRARPQRDTWPQLSFPTPHTACWSIRRKTTRLQKFQVDECTVHCCSLDAKLTGSTTASRRLVVTQHPCHFPSYVSDNQQ